MKIKFKMTKEKAVELLMNETGCSFDEAKRAYDNDYLTINKGRDGKDYAWYVDETNNIAISENGETLSEEQIENLLV